MTSDDAMTIPATSDEQFDLLLRKAAHGAKQDREAALAQIAGLDPAIVVPRATAALDDANPNMRKAAAIVLGELGGDDTVGALNDRLAAEPQDFVRVCIVQALQQIGSAAGPALERALGDDSARVQGCAATALGHLRTGSDALVAAFAERRPRFVRDQIAIALGRVASPPAIKALEAELAHGEDPKTRAAAVRALVGALGEQALPRLRDVARDDDDAKVRCRAVELAASFGEAATALLAEALVRDADARVTAAAAEGLATLQDGPAKVQAVIDAIATTGRSRGDLDADLVVSALAADGYGADAGLTEHLIRHAVGCPDELRGVLAALIIASADGSTVRAGELLNAFATTASLPAGQLEALRIEIGGVTALDPLLRILQSDLRHFFQEPIHQLNEDTRQSWLHTIEAAQNGFRWRMRMSIAVFFVGMALLIVSSMRFLFGDDLSTEQLFGSGVSFFAGVASVLLTIYSGPLKDIRQSVRDLSAASAAFIGYVHTVLQISHTFSSQYLQQRMTFAEMKESSALLQAAMTATVVSLGEDEPPAPE